jgi:hypothetical protein
MSNDHLDPESMAKMLAHLMQKLEDENLDSEVRDTSPAIDEAKDVALPSAITADTLAAIADEDLWWKLTDYVQAWLRRFEGPDYKNAERLLPPGLQFAWQLAAFEFEVPNGGFEQYFSNSSGEYAATLLCQLKTAGAVKRGALLEKAIALFEAKAGRLRDHTERWFGPMPPEEECNQLLQDYIRVAEEDDIRDWFPQYVRSHPEEFYHVPETKEA